MTKNTRKLIIAVLMLVVVCLYFVSGTYARYTESITGDAKVSTATWAVEFKDGTTPLTNISNLTFAVQNNTNVVPGKIAPSVTAKATINVDLTGTEVAVDYTATIDKTALATFFGDSANNVTVKVNGSDSATGTIDLINKAAFTSANGVVPIEISITWADTNTETTNAADKAAAGKDLTLPVTLTIQQHI